MTKVTSQNDGSPQITRVLRDWPRLYGGGPTIWASRVSLARVKTVQDLISLYEKSAETTAPSNLTVTFEQVSGDAQFGGASPRDEPTSSPD